MPRSVMGTTIVALATPTGVGGIAVIRVSGATALKVAMKITGKPIQSFKPRLAIHCPLLNKDQVEIDTGIVTYFKGPNSYTGEDVIEISCHGGYVLPGRIINSCMKAGCAPAAPGEFTKRAFLNGKIDLSQAEAVAEIISSKSELSQNISYKYLSGKFSNLINNMKDNLLSVISLIEAELDFSTDEISTTPNKTKIRMVDKVIEKGNALISTYSTGRLLKEGALVAITGNPNVGKSSLLNAIISEDRVIVTDVPGTTRDAIEVFYKINGLPVRFVDTAGIRDSDDEIEIRGVEISREFINRSDLVLWVFDVGFSLEEIENHISDPFFDAPFIPVLNKIDLLEPQDDYSDRSTNSLPHIHNTSALKGMGIKELTNEVYNKLISDTLITEPEMLLTNSRHRDAIEKCVEAISETRVLLIENIESDLIASRLRDGLFELDKILGITTADDILENIFSNFCVGK